MLPPRDCLNLNVDAGFKEGEIVMTVLTRDDTGRVKGLWSGKKKFWLFC